MDSVRILPVTIALVVFTGVLAPEMRAACPDFGAATGSPFAAGTSPRSLAIADINRDGKLDLVIANFTSNNVSILLGNGAGGFSPAAGSPFTAGTGPTSVTIADFNGNGKLDVAVANSSSNDVTLLLGDGTGGFSPAAGF